MGNKLVITSVGASVLAGALVFVLFFVASTLALDRDLQAATAHVAAAFDSGELVLDPY